MKKLLTLVLTILLAVSVAGCGCNSEEGATDATGVTETILSGETALMIEGIPLSMDDFYVYLTMGVYDVQQSESGSGQDWENFICSNGYSARDNAIDAAVSYAQQLVGSYAKATALGIYTAEEDAAAVSTAIANLGGEEEIKTIVASSNFSEAAFRNYLSYSCATDALILYEAEKAFQEDAMTAQHVLIMFEEGQDESVAYDKAMEVYNKAVAGEDFDSLIEQYNEDPGQTVGGAYTFADGEMVTEFYEGTKALEIGGISEPIKSEFGYHVIKRCPLIGTDSETYDAEIQEIMQRNPALYETVMGYINGYTVERNEDLIKTADLSSYTTAE